MGPPSYIWSVVDRNVVMREEYRNFLLLNYSYTASRTQLPRAAPLVPLFLLKFTALIPQCDYITRQAAGHLYYRRPNIRCSGTAVRSLVIGCNYGPS